MGQRFSDASLSVADYPALSADALVQFRHGGINWDQRNGLGAVPDVANVEYMGFVALVRPSVFLELCLKGGMKDGALVDDVVSGRPVSMGFLKVDLEDGEPQVRGHEGRHRAKAILEAVGDDPIPVAFLLAGGDRARHVTPDHLERLASGIHEQTRAGRGAFVEGPIFERVFLDGREIDVAPAALSPVPG